MRVSVFGLGYVGSVSCACFAHDGMDVIGVDVSPQKVKMINEGRSPIIEERIGEMISKQVAAKRLRATTNVNEAVLGTDLSVVSVGTPSNPNGSIDVSAVVRVCQQIGGAIAMKPEAHVVVVRSTCIPGTVRSLLIPALESTTGRKLGNGLGVCFNPEFLREGSSVRDHYDPPFVVIGRDSQSDGELAARLYAGVKAEVLFTSIETAETVKYVCNSFHALKATFANEMGIFAAALGVDGTEVMAIACRDTKLNISPRYLRPGFAFGGSCLPKDVRAILHKAKERDLQLPLTESIMLSNRAQIDRVLAMVLALRKRRVGVLGLSFKAGTDDLRESPLVALTEGLIGKGYDIRIYDQNISLARLVGANKTFIEKEIPHISSLLVPTLEEAVQHGEVLIVGNAAPEFHKLPDLCHEGQTVVDLVRVEGLSRCEQIKYIGVAW